MQRGNMRMKDIIEELWYGNIVPHEMYLGKKQEYKSVLSLVCEIREKINRTLTEDQIVAFLFGGGSEIGVFVARLRFARESGEQVLFGLRSGIRILFHFAFSPLFYLFDPFESIESETRFRGDCKDGVDDGHINNLFPAAHPNGLDDDKGDDQDRFYNVFRRSRAFRREIIEFDVFDMCQLFKCEQYENQHDTDDHIRFGPPGAVVGAREEFADNAARQSGHCG